MKSKNLNEEQREAFSFDELVAAACTVIETDHQYLRCYKAHQYCKHHMQSLDAEKAIFAGLSENCIRNRARYMCRKS